VAKEGVFQTYLPRNVKNPKNKEDSTSNMLHNVCNEREHEWGAYGITAGSHVATML
jgi:hypothetical protein